MLRDVLRTAVVPTANIACGFRAMRTGNEPHVWRAQANPKDIWDSVYLLSISRTHQPFMTLYSQSYNSLSATMKPSKAESFPNVHSQRPFEDCEQAGSQHVSPILNHSYNLAAFATAFVRSYYLPSGDLVQEQSTLPIATLRATGALSETPQWQPL
ncbi:hypothetical protein PYCCODRAFT_678531 [Trametes coccinea BRFM310]|uniref:Uncharacterized protein n=1 Tax=Trametes coccinea (strain BRFM310) TaxID=1353009 RepID=A0A1Y2IHQ5_TRAC3|nr:hypothetical protein PYCCODRAFT_678531 [Trametes coccinea BRFM310]